MPLDDGRRLVRDLAAVIVAGGADGEAAAMQLGLFVERDVANLDPHSRGQHDDYLAGAYGARVAAQHLSPLAIHEARAVLRAQLRRDAVPSNGLIIGTINARAVTVPDFVALLDRTLDDPAREAAAHQAVRGLAIESHDPRAIAALRRAAAGGHGDARDTARSWLALHDSAGAHSEANAPISRRSLGERVTHLQRRPDRGELIAVGEGALLRLDAAARSEKRNPIRIPVPTRDVRAWCFRDDGNRVLLLAPTAACLVSLDEEAVLDVASPFDPGEDTRYSWHGDRLLLLGGARPYRLVGQRFEPITLDDVRRDDPGWWDELETFPLASSRVLRTEPWRIVAFDETAGGRLAAFERFDRRLLLTPTRRFTPAVAFGGHFYLLDDFEIDAVDATGDLAATFTAPDGLRLCALDIAPPHLAVVAVPLDGAPSELLLYDLSRSRSSTTS